MFKILIFNNVCTLVPVPTLDLLVDVSVHSPFLAKVLSSLLSSVSKAFISKGNIIYIFCYNDDITYGFIKSLTFERKVPLHVIKYG